jgi:hypothetical protein
MQPQIVQVHSTLYDFFYTIYPELKFWGSAGFALWLLFQGVNWIKQIKTNDLAHIHETVVAGKEQAEKQTEAIVTELRELRSELRDDLRSLSAALLSSRK